MLDYGMDILKGEWTCVAAETLGTVLADAYSPPSTAVLRTLALRCAILLYRRWVYPRRALLGR